MRGLVKKQPLTLSIRVEHLRLKRGISDLISKGACVRNSLLQGLVGVTKLHMCRGCGFWNWRKTGLAHLCSKNNFFIEDLIDFLTR
jgi:hypothetical protein